MNDSIARTEFILLDKAGNRTAVTIELGRPRSTDEGDWACETKISPLFGAVAVHGEDSFQALSLGLRHVGQTLGALNEHGMHFLMANDGGGFPLEAYFFLPTLSEETRSAALERPHIARRLLGRWRITEVQRDASQVNIERTAFIEFSSDDGGRFKVGTFSASLDYRWVSPLSDFTVHFTWDGFDSEAPVCGRGRASILINHAGSRDGDTLTARLFVHLGAEIALSARRIL